MKNKTNYKTQGKKNRAAGARFELKVRKDLESKRWIVDRWANNVEFGSKESIDLSFEVFKYDDLKLLDNGKYLPEKCARLVKVKNKFLGPGKPMMLGAGFPDFLAYRRDMFLEGMQWEVVGIECKSNSYLDKEEKGKCKWMLENNIFSKILIASKGTKRGQIVYKEFNAL